MPNNINQETTQQLIEWKELWEKWGGMPYSYKQIIDELEIRDRRLSALESFKNHWDNKSDHEYMTKPKIDEDTRSPNTSQYSI